MSCVLGDKNLEKLSRFTFIYSFPFFSPFLPGVLRQITMNDLPVGRSVDETLRLLQAFQHTDKHGEVCPADWTPGKATIIPDPLEKMKYFEGANKK